MGLLGSIWSSVKKGARRIGKKVTGTVRSVGKKVRNVVKYVGGFLKSKLKAYKKNPIQLLADLQGGFVHDLYKEKGKYYLRKGKEVVEIAKKIVKDLIKTKDYDDAAKRGGELANKLRKIGMMVKAEANPVGVTKNTAKQIFDNAQQ